MRLPILLIALTLFAVPITAACGDDEEAVDGEIESAAPQTIEIAAKDFSFTPGKLQAEAGRSFDVALRNSGSVDLSYASLTFDSDTDLLP